jgi:hypothetical protein
MTINSLLQDDSDAKIVQLSDEKKTLPDGSQIIYAENKEKIILYHKVPFEKAHIYVYNRKTGSISINGQQGTNVDKRSMLKLGSYFLDNSKEDELVTLSIKTKDKK